MTALHVEIRVAGSLPQALVEELGDIRVITSTMETVLTGQIVDQAALIGLVNQLQAWGIELHAVRQVPPVVGQVQNVRAAQR